MRKLLDFFKITLEDSDEFTCCTPSFISVVNPKSALCITARNLSIAEKSVIITPCSGCFRRLKEVQVELMDETLRSEVNQTLSLINKTYLGTTSVKHIIEFIMQDIGIEKIKKHAKYSLKGLKIAAFYGCHLIRPSKIVQFDDPEDPTSIDSIIAEFEGEILQYEGKMDCCGGPLKTINDEISLDLLEKKLKSLEKLNVDAVVLACPFCFFQFEFGQRELLKKGTKYNLTIITITELLGLVLGLDPKELGLNLHMIKTKSFLNKFQERNNLGGNET